MLEQKYQKQNGFCFMLLVFVVVQSSLLTYDTGNFALISSGCKNGQESTQTVNFNGIFYKIPQIILGLEHVDQQFPTDFRVTIQNVQKTSFDLYVICPGAQSVIGIKYQWYAIDDDRIQVINSFNNLFPTVQTFNHQLPSATKGIISIISFGVGGTMDFLLSITSLTSTQVTVDITSATSIKSLGYQVILGVEEAFQDTQIIHHTQTYTSGAIVQQPKSWFFLGYCGMAQEFGNGFRQKFVRTSVSQSYTVTTWYGAFIKAHHIRTWITYQFTTYKAFECYTIRISQLFDLEVAIKPQIYIDIGEINQSFSSSSEVVFDKPITQLTISTYMKCAKSKKIVSKFLKCESCSSKNYYQFTHYCHGTINEINYFPRYRLNQLVYKQLNIEILSDKITVTQPLRNPEVTNPVLIEIKIQAL
ncbi:unnamed protein product [Paramecium sonneborni]|uniref:H-type lectin domain-containing protein n=1 Tax=Paramecium sonneborni TaxID=65129 RepID=A0A8S1QL52_9CILI|nr:unnamed protein product [Paramecium sonneborni]